ncbi:anti-sigma factor [Effusibacillus pohliae]|uniref:anti-sigma factor n=1 Tax=Effusibacillus pohliae TaxID=232270 RepID=UPI00037EF239|nr:anti-sigma factor [Effusibacillus pohliae]
MIQQPDRLCSDCLSYLLGELPDAERVMFEEHLRDCPACRQHIAELQPALAALPYAADRAAVPNDLKQRVLQSAFEAKPPAAQHAAMQTFAPPSTSASVLQSAWQLFLANPYGKLATGLVTGLTAALAVSVWQIHAYRQLLSIAPLSAAPPTQVERSFPLYATGENSAAAGVAYLAETPNGVQLIVQVHNAPPLTGEQAYQVWLLKNGQRQNAGTFRVNEKGDGVLVYAAGNKPDFDNIGITREPDANGTSPRGPKVLGTKK